MNIRLVLPFVLVAAVTLSHGSAAAAPDPRTIPPASWAPLDTADSLWRRGRVAVADEAWREAAEQFRRLTERYPRSVYAGDALYWQAFALQRIGGNAELREAVRALEQQKEKYPQAGSITSGESPALLTRLNGRLARAGDSDAAMHIAEAAATLGAQLAAEIGPAVAGVAAAATAEAVAELARQGPEMQRAMAEARREMERAGPEMARALAEAQREVAMVAPGRARRGGRYTESDIPPGCEGVIDDERIEALNALMQMNAEQAMPILKRVLARRDKCSEILRRKAVFLVSQRRSDEAANILVDVARNDPDSHTRGEAVFWLSQTNSAIAVDVLEQILTKDPRDDELQKRAIFSLSQTRSPRASAILRDYVRRTDAPVDLRADAIFWLGQQRGEDSSPFLRELFPTLNSDDLREKVLFSLSQRRSTENAAWMLGVAKNPRMSGELRKSALFWAGEAGASARDLGEIYDNSGNERELRGQVIFTLSQRRNDTVAVDKLLDIARKEQDPELRKQALFWLGQSRDPRAAAILEEIINKPI
jgi:HEAT repeat protein